MEREESPLIRGARKADLDWSITTSVLVLIGLMTVVFVFTFGLVTLFDALVWLMEGSQS